MTEEESSVALDNCHDSKNNLTGLLARCYQEELTRYRALVALAEQISSQISAAEVDGMTENLTRQASLVDEIDTVERQASVLRREVAENLGLPEVTLPALKGRVGLNAGLVELCGIMEEMAETLQCLAQLQDANKSLLSSRLSAVREELGQLRRGKTAARAYFPAGNTYEEARFVDRKS